MAIISIPRDLGGQWIQNNHDPSFGNLSETFNCDLHVEPGVIVPSRRMVISEDSIDEPAITDSFGPMVYFADTGRIYALTDAGIFDASSLTSSFNIDLSGSFGNSDGTGVVFNEHLYMSTGSDIAELDDTANSWDDDWWTNTLGQSSLSGGIIALAVSNIDAPLMLIGAGENIHTVDESLTPTTDVLTISNDYQIRWIVPSSTRVWFGVEPDRSDGKDVSGLVYEWDGGSNKPTRVYDIGFNVALACALYNETPYIFVSDGSIRAFDGAGFRVVGSLPSWNRKQFMTHLDETRNSSPVTSYAMKNYRDKIYISIDTNTRSNEDYDGHLYRSPSGIYVFDPRTGSMNHQHSFTLEKDDSSDYGQLLVTDNDKVNLGEIVFDYSGIEDAILGAPAIVIKTGSTEIFTIQADDEDDTLKQRMHFATTRIPAPDVEGSWDRVIVKTKPLQNADDEIVVKYRTKDYPGFAAFADITWSDTNTFTTTETDFSVVENGDEITICRGYGSGTTMHISSITEVAGTYTVNLDEDALGVSATNTGIAKAERWTKLNSSSGLHKTDHEFVIGERSRWIEIKVEYRLNTMKNSRHAHHGIEEILLAFNEGRDL